VAKLGSHISAENPPIAPVIDADSLVRSLVLAAVFLLLWITFRPFEDLSRAPEVSESGTLINQVGYSLLFIVLAGWCFAHNPRRLLPLVRPILIVTLAWFALTVVTSWESSVSARRLAFMLITLGIAGMTLLLPKNVRHFSDVMAAVVLFVLAACYLGVLLAPELSVHQPTDYIEPELAGDWRGVFAHKNQASATMVIFIFIGLFVARARSVGLGLLIVVLSSIFLVLTRSKTSIAILPMTLLLAALITHIRRPAVGIVCALSIVAIFNVLSIGSIYFEPVRHLLDAVLTDSSFTGRTDIWQFAFDHVTQRPITGYGFAAFWGSKEVVYGMGEGYVWANVAAHAHNDYLNLALTVGIPGSILVTLWLVLVPLLDFYRSPHDASADALKLLFLRVCLFAAYASCFESMLIQEGALGLFLFMSAFGLRLFSVSHVTARATGASR